MTWYIKNPEFYLSEQRYIKDNHPDLHFQERDDRIRLIGDLSFTRQYESTKLSDSYFVDIRFPDLYPEEVPFTWEPRGRIPDSFHHFSDNGPLCLGPHLDIHERFQKSPCIKTYIEDLLEPFLFSYSYGEKCGSLPWSDLPHGGEGIYQYYQEVFGTESFDAIIHFLSILSYDKYRGHLDCPCGSGKRIRDCHGPVILAKKRAPSAIFRCDLWLLKNMELRRTLKELWEFADHIKSKEALREYLSALKGITEFFGDKNLTGKIRQIEALLNVVQVSVKKGFVSKTDGQEILSLCRRII